MSPEELKAKEQEDFNAQTRQQVILLAVGGALTLGVGLVAPASFMQHFIVFVLAVFVGFQVIWNVKPCSSYAVDGCYECNIIDYNFGRADADWFGFISSNLTCSIIGFMAGINIFGGFLVTRRMLAYVPKILRG